MKPKDMACEEEWPIGKKAAFYTLGIIVFLAIMDCHGQANRGGASSLHQGGVRGL